MPLDVTRRDYSHEAPQFLPDGRHFLFHVKSGDSFKTGTYVGSLDSAEMRRVLPHDAFVRFAPPGYLLFVRDGTLLAQPFDVENLATTDEPVPVVGPVGIMEFISYFSVSDTGVLTYRPPTESGSPPNLHGWI